MRRSLVVLALFASVAVAQEGPETGPPTSWADPTLEDALFGARVVVRGHIQAPQTNETEPRFAIEKIVAGEGKPGLSVPLHGTKGGPALDALLLPPREGDDAILILRMAGDEKKRLELPTPSFGRFTVRDGVVAASVRDSFVRVEMRAEAYEEFLKNAWAKVKGGSADAAFVASCRSTLASLDTQDPASLIPAHVALEGLCFGAEPRDAKLAQRFFASPKFQLRLSAARLLARAGGEDAGDALMRLALNDADPAVRSVAIAALAVVKPTPKDATKELLAHLKGLETASVQLHVNVEDPRTNELPAPLAAAFETLRGLGAGAEATPYALELLSKDEADELMTGCLHLAKVKAKARVPEIVEKMRPADHPFTFSNEKIGELLEELTGVNLGDDREAWRKWVKNEKK